MFGKWFFLVHDVCVCLCFCVCVWKNHIVLINPKNEKRNERTNLLSLSFSFSFESEEINIQILYFNLFFVLYLPFILPLCVFLFQITSACSLWPYQLWNKLSDSIKLNPFTFPIKRKGHTQKAKVFDLFFDIGVYIRVMCPNVDDGGGKEQAPSDLLEYQWSNL